MDKYVWQYCSLGGAIRVKIASGEDIAHLGELDQKLWTVLSCPVAGLDFDSQTLDYIDTEKDGKIMVKEVVTAAQWLSSVIKDKDLILNGDSVLKLSEINTGNPTGRRLYDSAKQILANLGIDKNEITVENASDSKAIFAGTKFNGDGIITPLSSDNIQIQQDIKDCIATMGGEMDRSGEPGVTAEKIEAFYKACGEYVAWKDKAQRNMPVIFPYGDSTQAAYDVCNELKDKISDYFKRCSLLSFDRDIAVSVSVEVKDIASISECPLAHPVESGILPFKDINPAWQEPFMKLKSLVLDVDFKGKDGMDETEWQTVLAKFDPYLSWLSEKAGLEVESLGIERLHAILAEDAKQELLFLVEKDKSLKAESDSIDEVKKLMLYYRDFYRLLKNFVLFTDFYSRAPGVRAIFEAGQLYIDQRCCDLCIKVADMGKHADMAKLSGMFLIYCTCTNIVKNQKMDIVAVMTDGDIEDLRPGKNGVFYDLQGCNWDAVITKIVDNPVSISQAFWSPYRKVWEFCVGLINKSASDKEAKISSSLQEKVALAASASDKADPSKKQQAFDIARFAGIFAAFGMALGFIGQALAKIASGIMDTPVWKQAVALAALILVISGPSCVIAWMKLRKRNLGPVLNANGWAINSRVLVNILFGNKLTSVAKYPKLRLADPYDKKTPAWKIWLPIVLIVLAVVFVVLFLTGNLACIGLDFNIQELFDNIGATPDGGVPADSTSVE